MNALDKRIREIKNENDIQNHTKYKFPSNIKTRLDLLLFILNRKDLPNSDLLQYDKDRYLYESYWDIVFSLGLIDKFPITEDFYMYNGKIEQLNTIDDANMFTNNPLKYLSSKNINEGSGSGASDITFVYKKIEKI